MTKIHLILPAKIILLNSSLRVFFCNIIFCYSSFNVTTMILFTFNVSTIKTRPSCSSPDSKCIKMRPFLFYIFLFKWYISPFLSTYSGHFFLFASIYNSMQGISNANSSDTSFIWISYIYAGSASSPGADWHRGRNLAYRSSTSCTGSSSGSIGRPV